MNRNRSNFYKKNNKNKDTNKMIYQINNVRRAIDLAGGPTKISNLLNVSNGTVHNWIKLQRVPNIDFARQLATLSGMSVEKVRPV